MSSSRAKRNLSTRRREPLDVELTVDFIFGDEPGERVTMIDQRHIPMINDIFEVKDTVMRQFILLMLRASATQPKVVAEVVPAIKLLPKILRRRH